MNSTMILGILPHWQDRLGRGLMWLAALGAFSAFVSAGATVNSAAAETVWVETCLSFWHCVPAIQQAYGNWRSFTKWRWQFLPYSLSVPTEPLWEAQLTPSSLCLLHWLTFLRAAGEHGELRLILPQIFDFMDSEVERKIQNL
jgi:hypothetical protein